MARKIKSVLIDLSGTLHIECNPIPGAVEALRRLRNTDVKIRFVTNTTKESKRVLHEHLFNMGFEIHQEEVFTSLTAARNLVEKLKLRPMLLLEDAALEDFSGLLTENPNSVVVGLAPNHFSYEEMNKAFKLLLGGAPLIAIHKGRYYQRTDGPALGPGPFVAALEYATDIKAEIVGKPKRTFFLEGLSGLDCKPEEAVMIGDDVRDDVGGAQDAGMVGILVKTGKYKEGDEIKIEPPPNFIFNGFPSAVDYIVNNLIS